MSTKITNSIMSYIETQLKTLTVLENRVYKSTLDANVFPCAIIHFEGRKKADADTNMTVASTLEFKIQLMFDITGGTMSNGAIDEALYDLADDVYDLFDNDRQPSSVHSDIVYLEPATGSAAWLDDTRQKRYTDVTLTFDVEKEVN